MGDPHEQLSRFLILAVLISWPVAIGLAWWLRRRCFRKLERLGEASSEEIIAELDEAYTPLQSILVRTQAEYLPFVIESIREQVDSGLGEDQVRCLHERLEGSRPNEERMASFTVECGGVTESLTIAWIRDDFDRIDLRVRALPRIIHALRAQKKRIPRANPAAPAG